MQHEWMQMIECYAWPTLLTEVRFLDFSFSNLFGFYTQTSQLGITLCLRILLLKRLNFSFFLPLPRIVTKVLTLKSFNKFSFQSLLALLSRIVSKFFITTHIYITNAIMIKRCKMTGSECKPNHLRCNPTRRWWHNLY